ncbi:unnamed protein product [Leptidea sinapis]|uniref:CCHC-type domain-containing protein n=1 Tax=Leptidea sinapis TaxID=189913 RepID=A0A5E4QXA7_9NEOP|nr:unnamed protein product [Leptidea sinapis]
MVCKEDVVSWFKELESYKRIDAMCTLLNMCLPFELRFIGTYLEELGKRDFQELRGAELRANNPTDLAADIGGADTDSRTRRKMALYVSLLRSCNFACATTLYNAMVNLEQSGLLKGLYGDLLEEILLLYTMALHHPAFTFDQKSHFGEILDKLKLEDQQIHFHEQQEHISVTPVSSCHTQPGITEMISGTQVSGCHTQQNITPNMSVPPPNLTNIGPPPGLMFVKSPSIQPTSSDPVPEINSPPVLSGPSGLPMMADVPRPPPGIPIPQYNIGEYITPHTWPANIIVAPLNQPLEVINYQPPGGAPPSPLVSSPGDSRAASPRSRRRPSRDRSPPLPTEPSMPHLSANFENLTVGEVNSHLIHFPSKHHKRRGGAYLPPRSSSDSGSSAGSSPPGTPAPHRRHAPGPPLPPVPYHQYPRPYPYQTPPPGYRPPPPPFANGEPPPYPTPAPYPGFVPVLYAPPKLSCWNCGAAGHAGHECKEPSLEEMTRAGGYQLDFGGNPPPETADK